MDAAFLASLKGPGALRGAPSAADDEKPRAEAAAAGRDEIKREAAAHERLELGSPAASVSSDGGSDDDGAAKPAAAKPEASDEIGSGDADDAHDAAGPGEPSVLERMFEVRAHARARTTVGEALARQRA